MNTTPDLQLSSELAELCLENKEWRSEIDFLKDELRFFKKLLTTEKLDAKSPAVEEFRLIETNLAELQQQIEDLEGLISKHKQLIESIFTDNEQHIGVELIEQNAEIRKEIKQLLAADRTIKKNLFELVEGAGL